jgi:hypothetical protein
VKSDRVEALTVWSRGTRGKSGRAPLTTDVRAQGEYPICSTLPQKVLPSLQQSGRRRNDQPPYVLSFGGVPSFLTNGLS